MNIGISREAHIVPMRMNVIEALVSSPSVVTMKTLPVWAGMLGQQTSSLEDNH
jgi:hypothetical protein